MERPIPLHKALRNLEKAYTAKTKECDDLLIELADSQYELGREKARVASLEQQVKDLVQQR